jgi:hypothetical protein
MIAACVCGGWDYVWIAGGIISIALGAFSIGGMMAEGR